MAMSHNMIRCFIAISLSDEILDELDSYLQQLKKISPGVRWVKPAAIHITLKFLGEQPAQLVGSVERELTGISDVCSPFALSVVGTGCFPNRNRPRVFWLGLEHDAQNSLFKLHEWIDKRLEPLGFTREKRRFSPHLTIGRAKEQSRYPEVFEYFTEHPFPELKFDVNEVVFMRSELRPEGAKYTPIQKYQFAIGSSQ
jgi:2'-5' RNA ligase